MRYLLILSAMLASTIGFAQSKNTETGKIKFGNPGACSRGCTDNCRGPKLACKLTSPEMQTRKATVLASLKKQILEKKELKNGYSYRFQGIDSVVDELSDFIKTERLCCNFFHFEMAVAGDATSAWLTITGPQGTKDFIKTELGL